MTNPSHICHLPRIFLQRNFDFGLVIPPDVGHTDCMILWGGNPETSNVPQAIAMKEARERGAKLIVIDPRVTSYADEADIHAQLRPGTDGSLALGMLNVIIKEELYDREFVDEWTVGFEELGFILVISLLIWRLIERCIRKYIKDKDITITGWDKKQTDRPTTFMMSTKFCSVHILRKDDMRWLSREITNVQKQYLDALGLGEEIFYTAAD